MSKWILILMPALLLGWLPSAAATEGLVRGTVRRPGPAHSTPGAHVHVQLLDVRGKVIAERIARLSPTAPRRDASANYRAGYRVRFEEGEMARAASHRAVFHAGEDRP